MSNLPAKRDYTDEKLLLTLKNTVAKGATHEEFAMFRELCVGTGLDPFLKEIWFIKTGSRSQLMVGLNGYLKIANNHQMFDGMETTTEKDESGKLISATCKVYRKDRRVPSTATVYMAEYGKSTPIWRQMPHVMLEKCAKSVAIREAFVQQLSGTYTAEEMPQGFDLKKAGVPGAEARLEEEMKAVECTVEDIPEELPPGEFVKVSKQPTQAEIEAVFTEGEGFDEGCSDD